MDDLEHYIHPQFRRRAGGPEGALFATKGCRHDSNRLKPLKRSPVPQSAKPTRARRAGAPHRWSQRSCVRVGPRRASGDDEERSRCGAPTKWAPGVGPIDPVPNVTGRPGRASWRCRARPSTLGAERFSAFGARGKRCVAQPPDSDSGRPDQGLLPQGSLLTQHP